MAFSSFSRHNSSGTRALLSVTPISDSVLKMSQLSEYSNNQNYGPYAFCEFTWLLFIFAYLKDKIDVNFNYF